MGTGSRNPAIAAFFHKLDRAFFIDNEFKAYADLDRPLPIGHGQTISQPSLVLEMTLQLDPLPDSRILEIGTGSGFQTALLAEFARQVYTIERIEELAVRSRERLRQLGYHNIHYRVGDGSEGWPEHAPYDRILAAAGAERLPDPLLEQLAPGGRMIVPVGPAGLQELLLVRKDEQGGLRRQTLGEVRFVEFKGQYGWKEPPRH